MIGIGGYVHHYTNVLLKAYYRGLIDIIAAVEPFPENSSHTQWFLKHSIPIYPTLEQVYNNHQTADLIIVSSPIHHHVRQSSLALHQGSHVLCDKPLAVTVQDAESLIHLKNNKGLQMMFVFSKGANIPHRT
jgi:predicted dehydrogenase